MISEKDTVPADVEPPAVAALGSGWPAADSRVTARFQVQWRLVSAPLSAANSSQIKNKQTHGFTDIYNNKLASGKTVHVRKILLAS